MTPRVAVAESNVAYRLIARVTKHAAGLLLTAIAGVIFAATLVRLAPGADSDQRDFDPRLSTSTIEAMHAERAADRNLAHYYIAYLRGAVHGDFGISYSLQRPVRELIL